MNRDEPLPLTVEHAPPGTLARWDTLPLGARYQRLTQIAAALTDVVDAAAECDEVVEAALELRDLADRLLNANGDFTYLSPGACWEQNLPLAATGWRYHHMIGDR